MGIRGLTWRVNHYKTTFPGRFLEGGDFHLDLCNFTRAGCERFEQEGFLKVLRENIDSLEEFRPHSITMYFDSWYPLDKIPNELERQSQRLATIKWSDALLVNDLVHEELHDRYPHIEIVITGREAEDEIFDILKSQGVFKRKQFVFSSDSDCFTFDLPQSEMVYIVPLYNTKIWPQSAEMFKLYTLVHSHEVRPYLRNSMPASEGKSVVATHDPYKEGVRWREATYGTLLGEGVVVNEYRQIDKHTEKFCIESATSHSEELEDDLVEKGLVDVLMKALATSQMGGYNELKTDEKAIKLYLEYLKTDQLLVKASPRYSPSSHENLYRKCQVWCSVLVATFMSILTFVYSRELDVPLYRLGWKINPDDMYKRVQAFKLGI